MVGDDDQPAAGLQHPQALLQRHFQRLHLAVDLDAQGLEKFGQEFRLVLFGRAGLHGPDQLRRGRHGRRRTGLDQTVGNLPRCFYLAPVAQNAGQVLRGVVVHHVGRREPPPLVHAHVERSLSAERESALHGVEMVRRNPQVGQNAVDLRHAAQPQRPPQEAEIALHVVKTRIVGTVLQRVAVLVETVQTAFRSQGGEDAARMAASAESEVGVSARRFDSEQSHRLFQQYGSMVLRHNSYLQRSIWV